MPLGAEVSKRVGRGDGSDGCELDDDVDGAVGVSASSDVGLGVVTMTSRAASARAVCVAATSTVTAANAASAALRVVKKLPSPKAAVNASDACSNNACSST